MEKYFPKRPFSFRGVAHVQEAEAGTSWASMLKRQQKRQLIRQRYLAPQRSVPADGSGGCAKVRFTRGSDSLRRQSPSSGQNPWKPPGPVCSPRQAGECTWRRRSQVLKAHNRAKIKFRGSAISKTRFWPPSSVKPTLTFCYAVSRCGWIRLIFNE